MIEQKFKNDLYEIREKTVLMILQGDFPPDIRIEKEMKALSDCGKYKVALLCNNNKNLSEIERVGKFTVFRLSFRRKIGRKLNRLKNYPLWFNIFWLVAGFRVAARVKPKVIHVHDLPLVFLGLLLARVYKAKLVYDLHENYPATFYLWEKSGIFRHLVRNKKLAVWYDKFCLKKADGVIVIDIEHKNWIEKNYHINRKITIVSNTVDLNYQENIPAITKKLKKYQNNFVISYVGQISSERNLEISLNSIALLKNKIPNILFLIIGDGPEFTRIRKLTSQLQLDNYVVFTGWVPFNETATYILISNLCLIPRRSNDWSDSGTPNKLYQYMALGKPVVVSDAKALKRVVESCRCGEVFRSGDPQSLADAIYKIYKRPEYYGINGRTAVLNKYNWQNSSRQLIRLYNNL